MAEGVDYAWGRPGGHNLAVAGKKFAMRYVPYRENLNPVIWTSKGLDLWEKRDLLEHGLSIGMVWETFANRAKEGWNAGRADAMMCADGLAHCGMPSNTVIYFAVDFDANVGQRSWDQNVSPWIRAYLDGAASVIGRARTGVYGGYFVIEWALANGIARWGWQTYAWSAGHVSSHAHLLQYWNHGAINGVPIDLNKNLKADFGQYPRDLSLPPIPDLPDTSLPPPDDPHEKEELPMDIHVPNPPEMITIPASVVYREKPNKNSDKVQQFDKRKTLPLVGVEKGGEYEKDGKKFYRWGLVRLPAFWTDDPFDGKWAYVPIEHCDREQCKLP